jgi:hypothetical protein
MNNQSVLYGQTNDASYLNPKNEVNERQILKNLFKKKKQASKKRKNKNSPEKNSNTQKSEWIFEDDYNTNKYNDQAFKPGEAASTILPLQNSS